MEDSQQDTNRTDFRKGTRFASRSREPVAALRMRRTRGSVSVLRMRKSSVTLTRKVQVLRSFIPFYYPVEICNDDTFMIKWLMFFLLYRETFL